MGVQFKSDVSAVYVTLDLVDSQMGADTPSQVQKVESKKQFHQKHPISKEMDSPSSTI